MIQMLDGFRGLRALSPADKARLLALATTTQAPAGTWLFREGDPSDTVLLLVSGKISLFMRFDGRPDVPVLTLAAGELLGWSGLEGASTRVASARVIAPATLLAFPSDALLALCDQDHDIGYALMRFALDEVSLRLHDTRLQLLDMFHAR